VQIQFLSAHTPEEVEIIYEHAKEGRFDKDLDDYKLLKLKKGN